MKKHKTTRGDPRGGGREEREKRGKGAVDSMQSHSSRAPPVQDLIIPFGREVPQVPIGEGKSLKSTIVEVKILEKGGERPPKCQTQWPKSFPSKRRDKKV